MQNATNDWMKSWLFICTIQEISKVVCKKTWSVTRAFITSLCCMKRAHYIASVCCAKRIALSFVGVLHERVFWKQLCWLPDVVRVKKKEDFVQPLVAFPISNIFYWRLTLLLERMVFVLCKVDPYSVPHWISLFFNIQLLYHLQSLCTFLNYKLTKSFVNDPNPIIFYRYTNLS